MTTHGLPKSDKAPSQDAYDARSWDETVIAVMADGVGGARAGGEAAQRAVATLVRYYGERPRAWSPQKALGEFTHLLNARLYHDSLQRYGAPELVSTLCVAVIEGDRMYGLNVGDSRVYLARDGGIEQVSMDHTSSEPDRSHVLNQAIGMADKVRPHYFERELRDGDVALLCTDGVTTVLDDGVLAEKLEHGASARTIVAAARERAVPERIDDTSAIVLEIVETGRLRALLEQPFAIPLSLQRNDVVDGFTLIRPFQHSDRVWLATKDGERHTLKFAPLEAADSEPLLTAFVTETWNATRIGSRYFPRAFVPDGATARYYAMEFIEAPNLKTLLRSRRLDIEEGTALGRFLLMASQDLLRLDLVHGDLKPENILVLSGYDSVGFKLVDFGSVAPLFSLTSRAGTATYLAPERFREEPISERTEVFAIGVTLYEALTGGYPFGEIERYQTPHFHRATDPTRHNPHIPPWLAAVLLRATAPEPERRYQSYSEMVYDLDHPAQVVPFHGRGTPLLERSPLRLYQAGFFILLAVTIYLLLRLHGQ